MRRGTSGCDLLVWGVYDPLPMKNTTGRAVTPVKAGARRCSSAAGRRHTLFRLRSSTVRRRLPPAALALDPRKTTASAQPRPRQHLEPKAAASEMRGRPMPLVRRQAGRAGGRRGRQVSPWRKNIIRPLLSRAGAPGSQQLSLLSVLVPGLGSPGCPGRRWCRTLPRRLKDRGSSPGAGAATLRGPKCRYRDDSRRCNIGHATRRRTFAQREHRQNSRFLLNPAPGHLEHSREGAAKVCRSGESCRLGRVSAFSSTALSSTFQGRVLGVDSRGAPSEDTVGSVR